MTAAWWIVAAGLALPVYAYLLYPVLLSLLAALRSQRAVTQGPRDAPTISVSLPVYNGEATIRHALEALLTADYPEGKIQIVVVSDASTDRTDEIVREYAGRGVELLRLPRRGGKTAAENAAKRQLRGEIVVNTDACVLVHSAALKLLVARFEDSQVGVAGAREIPLRQDGIQAGESGYVDYEMWLRDQETRVSGMVGAAGCLYAIRAELHQGDFPAELSRDFASALIAREHGLRAVSVRDAVCYVPVTAGLQREYRRKVRTFLRGMQTLAYKARLLNPLRYGLFAWMLLSHKLCRWLVPVALALAVAALAASIVSTDGPIWVLGVVGIAPAAMVVGWFWPPDRPMPRPLAVLAYAVASNVAVLHAWLKVIRGDRNPTWEPTLRRAGDISASPYPDRPSR